MQNENPVTEQPKIAEKAPEPTTETPPTQPTNDQTAPQEPANWQFNSDETGPASDSTPQTQAQPVNWTASEFIEHKKNASWYLVLAGGTMALTAIIYLITKDVISAVVVVVVAIVFGVFASRKPRELNYEVNDSGIQIGEKQYMYADFKSFAFVQEGAVESIWLMPLKRFMPILTIYFDPADKDGIVAVINNHLPVQDHQLDSVDRLMHKIRF